jgi:cytochrome b6-f complex iron-sulfur subunit
MADENPPPPAKPAAPSKAAADPAPTVEPGNAPAAGAPPTAAPDHARVDHPAGTVPATTPPVATPPMTAAGEAAPAPRSNAASGVTDPAPPRAPGVAPAEAKAPAAAPVVPRPAPAAGVTPAERAPAAVNTTGPADATVPGGPNPVADAAAAKPAVVVPARPAVAAAPAAAVVTAPAAAKPAAPAVDESRRSFMRFALPVGWVAFSAACTSSLVATARFMFPNVLFEPPQSFKAGFPGEYNVGEVDVRWKDAFGVWVVREADGFYALIAVCTHLGCSPNWLPAENKFKCPCHGSGFYRTGVNFEGPAPRPLERARIVLSDDGQILIDKSVKFQEEKGEWTKPEAFLKA